MPDSDFKLDPSQSTTTLLVSTGYVFPRASTLRGPEGDVHCETSICHFQNHSKAALICGVIPSLTMLAPVPSQQGQLGYIMWQGLFASPVCHPDSPQWPAIMTRSMYTLSRDFGVNVDRPASDRDRSLLT